MAMKPGRTTVVLSALVAAMAFSASTTASATDDFPDGPVTMIVPFPPGGGTDTLARIIQSQLEETWGQPVVIENISGASGAVGTLAFTREDPDGYTILMASTGAILTLAREGIGMEDGGFNVENILSPITQVAHPPYIATVHPDVDVNSIEELIELAESETVTYGSSGVGSASHLTGILFQDLTGVSLTHVPYSGMGEAGPGLLGGEVQLLFAPAPVVEPHFEDGGLRPLAVTTAQQSGLFPDLPTISDTVEGFGIAGWFGLYGHEDTPPELIEKINADVLEAMSHESVIERMADQGAEPAPMSPEEYRDFVNEDIAMWLELHGLAEEMDD